MKRRSRRVEVHGDGTVTCWRPHLGAPLRSSVEMPRGGLGISVRDLASMTRRDRERVVAAHPALRELTTERTLVRARLSFVMELPLGSTLPSPTLEAIESAALAIAGPVKILPGSKISLGRTFASSSKKVGR